MAARLDYSISPKAVTTQSSRAILCDGYLSQSAVIKTDDFDKPARAKIMQAI